MVNRDFWKNKRVFVTGHTGFKGAWLTLSLTQLGAEVKGFSLLPASDLNLFSILNLENRVQSDIGDIRNFSDLKKSLTSFDPHIIIHLAAQPLVLESYEDPIGTYSTNVIGTVNLLEISRNIKSLKSLVNVTTDKCYENKEWVYGYRENDSLGGYDPYSSSKACSELVTSAYRNSFFSNSQVAIASARAGNVIGGGDWTKSRLVPDIIESFNTNKQVILRNPKSIRPWQHVLEPIFGYLLLAEKLFTSGQSFAEPFNFGPKDEDCVSVETIMQFISSKWNNNPGWITKTENILHEAYTLKLNTSKAYNKLGWSPKWDINKAIEKIINWNNAFVNNKNMVEYSITEIDNYLNG